MGRIERHIIEELLSEVQKPARYIGMELNSIQKEEALVRMALSYPDLYEVGMSNNGIRILYGIINNIADAACERVFAVANDMESCLRGNGVPLYTLETYTPLNEMDIIGFNVSHELLSTNILQILDLGSIPLHSSERGGKDPIVIAGGEGVSNPFPLGDFIDVFFMGDGEEGIVEILDAFKSAAREGLSRDATIDLVSLIDGVLIPSRYNFSYNGSRVSELDGKEVNKRVYKDKALAESSAPVVSNIRIAQERAVVEATRGCGNFCSFCHAGFYDLPYRSYSSENISKKILAILSNTGYNEVTFSSLSIGDYRGLEELLNNILPGLTERGVSISLPSLKIDTFTLPIIEYVSGVRRTSLTLAVESASEKIREAANKKLSIDDLIEIVEHVFSRGWKVVKLYFMIGLPGWDSCDEAEDIMEILKRIYSLGRKKNEINVTISPFVPKPHTPFQWEKQMDEDYFEHTISKIKSGLPGKIRIKNHDARASILEGVLSRGDSRLGEVIYRSYMDGCRLDSWGEHFDFVTWKKNLDDIMPEWKDFLSKRDDDERLPWDVIKTGFEDLVVKMKNREPQPGSDCHPSSSESGIDPERIKDAERKFEERYDTRERIRIRFAKLGMLRFVPHLDFVEIIKRGLRMADAPVAMTRGFNKREKLSAGFPLPLGIESENELFDVELFGRIESDFKDRLSDRLPDGIDAVEVNYLADKASLMSITSAIEYRLEMDSDKNFKRFAGLLDSESDLTKMTKKGEIVLSFKDVVESYRYTDDSKIFIRLFTGTNSSMRIDRILQSVFDKGNNPLAGIRIVKTAQFMKGDGELVLI